MKRTERTHEENQERAYIAASRRSDRSLEARFESARRASEIHKKRTGKGFRITELDVQNEEMYEEEEDDLPMQYRNINMHLQTGSHDFDARLQAYLANAVAFRKALAGAVQQGQPSVDFINSKQYADHESLFPKHSDNWRNSQHVQNLNSTAGKVPLAQNSAGMYSQLMSNAPRYAMPRQHQAQQNHLQQQQPHSLPYQQIQPNTANARHKAAPYQSNNSFHVRRQSLNNGNKQSIKQEPLLQEPIKKYIPAARHPSLPAPARGGVRGMPGLDGQNSPPQQFQHSPPPQQQLQQMQPQSHLPSPSNPQKTSMGPFSMRLPANAQQMFVPAAMTENGLDLVQGYGFHTSNKYATFATESRHAKHHGYEEPAYLTCANGDINTTLCPPQEGFDNDNTYYPEPCTNAGNYNTSNGGNYNNSQFDTSGNADLDWINNDTWDAVSKELYGSDGMLDAIKFDSSRTPSAKSKLNDSELWGSFMNDAVFDEPWGWTTA